MKDYNKKYFQDKERRHDINVNQTKDLVDPAEKTFKALLGIQGNVKNYGEKYFQDKVVEQKHDIILDPINLMVYHAENTFEVLLSIWKDLRHYSEKISEALGRLRQDKRD